MKKSKDFQEFGFYFKPHQHITDSEKSPANNEVIQEVMFGALIPRHIREQLQRLFSGKLDCYVKVKTKDRIVYHVDITIFFHNLANSAQFDFIKDNRLHINSLLKSYVKEAFVDSYLRHLWHESDYYAYSMVSSRFN